MLDLFSGTGSVSTVARQLGFQVLTVDADVTRSPDVCVDVCQWNYKNGQYGTFDWIHMSPPCTEFSILKKNDERDLVKANEIAMAARRLLDHFRKLNRHLVYTVENPSTSLLQHQEAVRGLPVHETSYCCYGMPYQKPTKIWSNLPLSLRRCPAQCFWRRPQHPMSLQSSPSDMRIKIPGCLCLELAMEAAKKLGCMPRAYLPVSMATAQKCSAPQSAPSTESLSSADVNESREPEEVAPGDVGWTCSVCGTSGSSHGPYYNVRKTATEPVKCRRCYRKLKKRERAAKSRSEMVEVGQETWNISRVWLLLRVDNLLYFLKFQRKSISDGNKSTALWPLGHFWNKAQRAESREQRAKSILLLVFLEISTKLKKWRQQIYGSLAIFETKRREQRAKGKEHFTSCIFWNFNET